MAEHLLGVSEGRPDAPERGHELPAAALLVLTAIAAAVFAQGGYYRTGQRAVIGLLVVAAVLAARTWRPAAARPLLTAAGALAVWTVLSAALAGQPSAALGPILVLSGGLVVVLTCQRLEAAQRDQLVVAVVALGVAVAVTGWVGVAWHRAPWALPDQGLWRAATTLTYANAAAGFLAVAALLSLARSAPTASCVLLTGLGATMSRGGLIAFMVGVLVLVRILGPGVVRAAVGPGLGAAVAPAGLMPSMSASSPARPALAVPALVAGVMVARLGPRRRRALALAAVPVILLLAVGPAGDATRAIGDRRVSVASSDRVEEAKAALKQAATRPLTGVGPGMADLSWERSDGSVLVARYAHNEYLQVLAELGVVGLALLVSLLAVIARLVRRSRPSDELRPALAGAAAGLVALGVHGLFDFGWHLPAIALTGALLVGIVTPTDREEQQA